MVFFNNFSRDFFFSNICLKKKYSEKIFSMYIYKFIRRKKQRFD